MGERLHGMQEVIGSSPLSSTTEEKAACEITSGFFRALIEISRIDPSGLTVLVGRC